MNQFTIVNRYQILEKLLDQPNNEKSIKYENEFQKIDSKRKREDSSSDYQPNKLRRQSELVKEDQIGIKVKADQSSNFLNHKELPYECEICKKSLSRSSFGKVGEMPYQC